jgi:hypothetical protein
MNFQLELLVDILIIRLDAPSCREFASLLKQTHPNSPPLQIDILSISVGAVDEGYAGFGEETISWVISVMSKWMLAEHIEALADAEISEDYFPHIHLEPCYLVASETISDVVIERLEAKQSV